MTRRHLAFACEGETLVATLDEGDAATGLLIVSGGNEVRSGAFTGQAQIAARLAASGYPVFRFDRRGVGDSSGENAGFQGSKADIAAALAAFRKAAPNMGKVVALGNCDAASALMLASGNGIDGLVLTNPWTFEEEDADADAASGPTLPPDAIRARYGERLRNPREWLRLLKGGVDLRKLAAGLLAAMGPAPPPSDLLSKMQAGLSQFAGPVRILLADKDRTAQAFAASWPSDDERVIRREGADHAFSRQQDHDWLIGQLLSALGEQAG